MIGRNIIAFLQTLSEEDLNLEVKFLNNEKDYPIHNIDIFDEIELKTLKRKSIIFS